MHKISLLEQFITIKSSNELHRSTLTSLQSKIEDIAIVAEQKRLLLFNKNMIIALVASVIIAVGVGFTLGEVASYKSFKMQNTNVFTKGSFNKIYGVENYFFNSYLK